MGQLKVIPWSHFQKSAVRLKQSELFNTGVGISIIIINEDHGDFFHFATNDDFPFMEDIYLTNQDYLIQYTHYFYDKAKKIIKGLDKKENRLTLVDRIKYKSKPDAEKFDRFDLKSFIKETTPKHYRLYHPLPGNIYLTKREYECLYYLTKGKTSTEIAQELSRSHRTIETQIKSLKDKVNLPTGSTKSDLIATISRCGFVFVNPQ